MNSITKKYWVNQVYFPSTFVVNVFMMMHSFVVPYASYTIFIFENYPVDTGNNNYMTMPVKVKMWYNVTNFTNHFPTGRFCNGRIQRHHELSQWWNSQEWMFPLQNPTKHSIVTKVPRNVFVSCYISLYFIGKAQHH